MRADAMTHLKYWFRISSILERTKNSTKTSNTSFERSDSGLLKSWRLGAWHSYWPATPTLYDKLNFLGKGGVASPWCCHAPVLQEYFFPLSGLSNEILYVFYHFYFSCKLSSNFKVLKTFWFMQGSTYCRLNRQITIFFNYLLRYRWPILGGRFNRPSWFLKFSLNIAIFLKYFMKITLKKLYLASYARTTRFCIC